MNFKEITDTSAKISERIFNERLCPQHINQDLKNGSKLAFMPSTHQPRS